MFRDLIDYIVNIVRSRMTVLALIFCFLGGLLIYRCFSLQIVRGEEFLNEFMIQTEKTRDISSTRGKIFDRNGDVLAYNELAYSVKIEDVFESNRSKNKNVNEIIYRLIKMIEKNGDHVITDFKIVIDENGEFAYTVEGTSRLRFLADVFGYTTIDKLKEEERAYTARELVEYLSRATGTGFRIGEYDEEDNTDTDFIPGKGYTKEDWL